MFGTRLEIKAWAFRPPVSEMALGFRIGVPCQDYVAYGFVVINWTAVMISGFPEWTPGLKTACNGVH